jgi:predicted amidohydrolase YtcJ
MRIAMSSRVKLFAAPLLAALAVACAGPVENPADTVFINGKVFTADAGASVQEAFALKGDKFMAVGTTADIRKLVGPQTKVVDLKGRFVSPGLTDNHFHNEGGGEGVDVSKVRTLAELLGAVKAAADKAAPGAVVFTNSDWHEAQLKEQRLPTAKEIDAYVADKPVVLVRGGHSYILNTAALNKWNITKATPVPAGGAISRDASGELTGELFDNAKPLVDMPPEPPVTTDDILRTQKAVNAYGITAVRVPGSYKGDTAAAYRLMKQVEAAGQSTLRWTVYMPGFGLRRPEDVAPEVAKWGVKLDEGSDWVRVGGVKLIVDGGFEGGHMSTPYAEPYGKGGTYSGVTVVPPAAYTGIVREFNRLGWRVTTHAVGDAGIDQVMDAYEAAAKDKPLAGGRWSIEHAFVARPEQLPRIKALDIDMSVQDHLYLAAPALKKYLGQERAFHVTPAKSYVDAGLLVSLGTDTPVIPVNPFWNLYHFLSRDTISDGVYGEDQKLLDRPTLLKLITINYAKTIGEEALKGSIEPGKYADFAVLSGDFLTVPPEQVRDMKALATYVGGKQVYADPSF